MTTITQQDRDAADEFYRRAADVLGPIKDRPADCPDTIRGCLDEALARHRELGRREGLEEAARYLLSLENLMTLMEPWHSRRKDGQLTEKTRQNIGVARVFAVDAAIAIRKLGE